jgi:glucokinase
VRAADGAPFAIGVDLGGTNLRAALVDPGSGAILAEERADIGTDRSPERVADLLERTVKHVTGRADRPIVGIGIGIAAMLRGSTGVVVNAPNLAWYGVDFRALARARLGPHLDLYNDLNAIAWGEHRFGAGKGARSLLCVYLGTGVGGGIVVEERLYAGAGHVAGEIGHVKVVLGPDARRCGCGQRGCIEAYAGGGNLSRRIHEELSAGASTLALSLAGGDPRAVHPGHLDEAAAAGDPYATRLWAEIGPLIGLVLANAVTLLNPDRLILGGGLWQGAPRLRAIAEETLRAAVNGPARENLTIVETTLGDVAGMLGAASLIALS